MRYTVSIRLHSWVFVMLSALVMGMSLFGRAYASSTITFSGQIDSLSPGYEIPGISVGDAVSGELSYNPATPDDQTLPWIGHYANAIEQFNVTIGSKVFTLSTAGTPTSEIDVINDDYYSGEYHDQMLFRVAVEEVTNPGVVRFLQLTFSASSVTPPTLNLSDALPENPDLNAYAIRGGFITNFPPAASQGSNFALTSITVEPVIEPRDLTGDGKADLVLRNLDTGYVYLWAMNGNLKTYFDIGSLPLNRRVVGIADLTGDGKADIVLRNMDTGYLYLWAMNGNLKTYYDIGSLPLNRKVIGMADLTGDGKSDIVLRNKDTGYLYLWAMNGNLKTYYGISSLPLNRNVVGMADLTGDGKDDIVLRNMDTGYLYMWAMNGHLKTYYGISNLPLNHDIVGVADLTGDGKADIVLRNMDTGDLYLWAMNGNVKTQHDIASLDLAWNVVQVSDLNGDDKADLVLRHEASGNLVLWQMNGNLPTPYTIGPLALNREIQPTTLPDPEPPVIANNDAASTVSDQPSTISVLANDLPNPAILSITSVTQPRNGVVETNSNGTVTYRQNGLAKESIGMGYYKTYCKSCHNLRGFTGTDTFSYVASDGLTSDTATVTVAVTSFDPSGPFDTGGDISGLPMSVCADLPHTCKAPNNTYIEAIGRFVSEIFKP